MRFIFTLWKSTLVVGLSAVTALYPAISRGQSSGANAPKLIKIVVPFEPGASTDIFARLVGQKLGTRIGSTVVVENRTGATGSIGAEYVAGAGAVADGSTLMVTSTPFSANAAVRPKLPFDPVRGFAPIAHAAGLDRPRHGLQRPASKVSCHALPDWPDRHPRVTDKSPVETPPGVPGDISHGVASARAAIGARLKAFQQAEAARILSACTRCGKCYEACPMTAYAKPAPGGAGDAADGHGVVAGVLAVLGGEQGSPAALGWIAVCCRSGVCVPVCPEQIDPLMMMRLARMTALGGRGGVKQLAMREDPDYFNRVRAFAKLQLSDEELKRWT